MNNSQEHQERDAKDVLLAEFTALRAEILKRTEIRYQLITVALVAPGTILAFAVQTRNAPLLLLYPSFALFLSAAWASNVRGIVRIAAFIRTRIESRLKDMDWEHFVASQHKRGGSLTFLAARGIFIGTQFITLIVGLTIATLPTVEFGGAEWITISSFDPLIETSLIIGVISIIATLFILRRPPIVTIPPMDH